MSNEWQAKGVNRMNRSILRWFLWVSCTVAAAGAAYIFGFYDLLWANDVTRLGFATIGLYAVSTAWLGWKVRQGDSDFEFISHIAKMMPYIGIVGTFWGFYLALEAFRHLPPDGSISPEFLTALMLGMRVKLLVSLVATICFGFLLTQIKILERDR